MIETGARGEEEIRMKKRAGKEYIVIGLGRFGNSVAKQLEALLPGDEEIRQIIERLS